MDQNYLLNSQTAKRLYERVRALPIVDYHNHLSVSHICQDKRYYDIYELWVQPDPYKHRAMRMCGVEERYITGNEPPREKFRKWCETLPWLVGNPLYLWAKMELETVFGITRMPNGDNSDQIYDACNDYMANNVVSANSLLRQFRVEYACPCVSLVDDIRALDDNPMIFPSLRGDDLTDVTCGFVKKLEQCTGISICDLKSFLVAVEERLKVFVRRGCFFSDHALDNGFRFYADDGKNEARFRSVLMGQRLEGEEKQRLFSYLLEFLGSKYAQYGFVLQLHIGAMRYTSSVLREVAGAAGGFAAIGNSADIGSVTRFLDTLDRKAYRLPKTILFPLNPADNAMIASLSGSYSSDGVKGLITQGPAWWWCDHKQGIREMLENSAPFSLLSIFVGMTTDSRSFLSFVRHDYFRRILCDFLGEHFEKNDFGCSYEELENIAVAMCYKNAKEIIDKKEI